MALESLSSFSSTGTVSGTNIVNNTQKINTVAIGTGDITIDATKIPIEENSTMDVKTRIDNVEAQITTTNNNVSSNNAAAVHINGEETIIGIKTFTPITKFKQGISIINAVDQNSSFIIRGDSNDLVVIDSESTANKTADNGNTIILITSDTIKIGSNKHKRVELGYDVDRSSNSNEIATTKWVNTVNTYLSVPAGTVITYAGKVAPEGYLYCDGGEVSRTKYSKLFGAIGTTFGNGDGATTFNLPKINDNRFIEYVSNEDFNKIDPNTDKGLKDAGLPNIEGELKGPGAVVEATGAFSASEDKGRWSDDSPDSDSSHIIFNANDSNPIYGSSETVQPKSITLRAYIKY